MKLNIIELNNQFIYKQLQLEEALLRSNDQNWCILNYGSKDAVVMGSSQKPQDLLDVEKLKKTKTPIIKRFSGGGTVYIDPNTLFITFIFQHVGFDFHPFPEPILRWSEIFYKKALNLENFSLIENDYTVNQFKCGGNAQYIRKNRWLHHSSFLWDYESGNMDTLLLPKKSPSYRKKRAHKDFLMKLKEHFEDKKTFMKKIKEELNQQFDTQDCLLSSLETILNKDYKKTLQKITL